MNRKRKQRLSALFFFLGAAMIITALLMVLHHQYEDAQAGKTAEAAVSALYAAIEEEPPENAQAVRVITVNGMSCTGVLSIPKLGLNLPVQCACSDQNLKQSPCIYSGTPHTGLVIAGHNYKTHFGRLNRLAPGDRIVFTACSGEELAFTVESLELLLPRQVEEMTAGGDLTLFTCTESGRERLTVRAKRS